MNAAEITARMYEAREALLLLNRPKFYQQVGSYQDVIKAAAEKLQLPLLESLISLLNDPDIEGWTRVWLIAAYVEMIEPNQKSI